MSVKQWLGRGALAGVDQRVELWRVLIYFGGANVYYDRLRESVDNGFPEMEFQRLAG